MTNGEVLREAISSECLCTYDNGPIGYDRDTEGWEDAARALIPEGHVVVHADNLWTLIHEYCGAALNMHFSSDAAATRELARHNDFGRSIKQVLGLT